MISKTPGTVTADASRVLTRLSIHVEQHQHQLGVTYAAETGFFISTSPDTVRAPDASFVSNQRLATAEDTPGYLRLAPDLVVEVVSPNDLFSDVETKAASWLDAGTLIVLVAEPASRTLRSYTLDGAISILSDGETFTAGEVCGDWELTVDDAFGEPR